MIVHTPEGWAVYHATCFAITSESDIDGLLSWARTFTASGVGIDDLVAATDWMVLNVAPEWRREHLAHIQARIQKIRLGRLAAARQNEEHGRPAFCAGCDDTGLVSVPHPRDVADGAWGGKYDCVVACPCGRGDAQVSAFAARSLSLRTLIRYEQDYPDWRDMKFRKVEHARQMAERETEAAVADKTAGPLVRRLAARLTMPRI